MAEKYDIECKIKRFRWINEKYMNELENSSGQLASFYIKLKVLKNSKHQMKKENAHMMESPGMFEILESKLRDEVMTTQIEKHEISV